MAKTFFDHINSIYTNQRIDYFDTLSDADKKTFLPYMINMGISMNGDLLPIVNEVNKYWDQIGPRELYLFYSQILPKGKQYNKWVKGVKDDSYDQWIIDLIAKHYDLSTFEAKSYLRIYYKTDAGRSDLRELLVGYGINDKLLKKAKL